MADYDFRSLSPHDFELLCRDLLQRALGVVLESFTVGRDSGIDFRYRTKTINLIVQCKHYAESGYGALTRVLTQKERKKLESLKPTRYVLATSVGLTPARKDDLLGTLSPYCVATGDIVGRDDLNNLLTQHPEVERQHYKLWLTSAAVLERVLSAGIFAESDRHMERLRQRLCRYVPNPSLDRAQAILEKSHFCIVAGIPGIGKTTLAEVLLTDLVDRHGFSAYRVTHDLSELQAIKNPKSKQVFYFDDFLGKTALDKLQLRWAAGRPVSRLTRASCPASVMEWLGLRRSAFPQRSAAMRALKSSDRARKIFVRRPCRSVRHDSPVSAERSELMLWVATIGMHLACRAREKNLDVVVEQRQEHADAFDDGGAQLRLGLVLGARGFLDVKRDIHGGDLPFGILRPVLG